MAGNFIAVKGVWHGHIKRNFREKRGYGIFNDSSPLVFTGGVEEIAFARALFGILPKDTDAELVRMESFE